MITAVDLAAALTASLVSVAHAGQARAVGDVEFIEQGDHVVAVPGDLVLAVGFHEADPLLALVERAGESAGVVVRAGAAVDERVVAACRRHGLTLLTLKPGVVWSHVVWLLRGYVDRAGVAEAPVPHTSTVYGDLFAMADTLSSIVGAPVTIEDPRSRVLAYSIGQDDVDQARLSTIVGRKVPAAVVAHFRARGVFRKLARSSEPVFVPEGPDGIRPRFIVPVRAGSEWLGSIWAAVDEPVPDERLGELRAAADVLALHLLRLRAQGELGLHLQAGRLRALLQGTATTTAAGLERGPWRVVALGGLQPAESVETRRVLWATLLGRWGWRQLRLTDVDDLVCAVVDADGDGPGSWRWLQRAITAPAAADPALLVTAGRRAGTAADLLVSRRQAAEQLALGREVLGSAATGPEECWAQVVLHRATRHLDPAQLETPLARLRAHDRDHGSALVETLAAVLGHWGDPGSAAVALGVHRNSVRNRLVRIGEVADLDLDDPDERLALQLVLAAG